MTTTTRAGFDALLATHRVIPVAREIFADAETPVGIYRKLAADRPGTFLLESAEQGVWNRYSFVGTASFGQLVADDGEVEWRAQGLDWQRLVGDDVRRAPLDTVAHVLERWRTPRVPGLPRLTGGLVGHIGWEAVREIERLPDAPERHVDVPMIGLSFVAELVVLDHRTGRAILIATTLADGHDEPDRMWEDAQRRLDDLQARLAEDVDPWLGDVPTDVQVDATASMPGSDYEAMVERSKQHIVDGDVFQVVLSSRFDLPMRAHPLEVYRMLRVLNPSPYLYLLALERSDGEPYHVVGSSPESLVTVHEGRATMHPIAGSRPRGEDAASDARLGEELVADPKERAEHVMLVDLARNDLAKVCVAGTVEVSEFMVVHRFSHIMHIVSTVEGTMRDDASAVDAFAATFPAGTLSGAPKPRALEIIDDLEPVQRGVYGGVVGYFDFAGDTDVAIAIRTVTIVDGVAHVQAGAGLVADSVPATELQEVRAKAAAPLRAVAIANAMRRIGGRDRTP